MRWIILLILLLTPAVYADITRDEAVAAIAAAELEVEDLEIQGYSTQLFRDLLAEANNALERADFAKDVDSPQDDVTKQAKKIITSLDEQSFSYESVLEHTDSITIKKQLLFDVVDKLSVLTKKINENSDLNLSTAKSMLERANDAFNNERYLEAHELITQIYSEIELQRSELTKVNLMVKTSKNFFQRNVKPLTITAVVFLVLCIISYYYIRKKMKKNRLKKLQYEEKIITGLMKKTQRNRFEDGTISKFLYNIRMKKYQNRYNDVLKEIKELKHKKQ